MAKVVRTISLTDDEILVLKSAKRILQDIRDDLDYGNVCDFDNSEYVTDIIDIVNDIEY